jgi:hypothetical protein
MHDARFTTYEKKAITIKLSNIYRRNTNKWCTPLTNA